MPVSILLIYDNNQKFFFYESEVSWMSLTVFSRFQCVAQNCIVISFCVVTRSLFASSLEFGIQSLASLCISSFASFSDCSL